MLTANDHPSSRSWLPTDAWVRLLLVPVLAFIAQASTTTYLADFWHHLARGRVIVTEGHLLDHDVFTYTVPGQQFQDVNWLAQVSYYVLYRAGGLALVQVVNALITALTMGWLVVLCGRLAGSRVAALAVGIAVFLGLWQVLTIRPQTFSLLLFVILFDVLERAQRQPWLLLAAPALMALWSNLHGAFPAGLILVSCFCLAEAGLASRRGQLLRDRRVRQLAVCLVACVLATLINPYGWHIYLYVGQTSNRAAARRIDEWVPPSLDQAIGVAFFASLVVFALLLGLAWKRRGYRPGLRDVVLAACFLPLALGSVRMVAWWLLVMAPLAAMLLAQILPAPQANENTPNLGAGLTVAALALVSIFSVPGLRAYNPLLMFRSTDRVEHDLDAVLARLTTDKPTGRIYTRFEWGEYVTWAGAPRYTVFMDGRIEIYPDNVWKEYEAVTIGRDWVPVLDAYQVDALILDTDYPAQTRLLAEVERSPGWTRVFQARSAVLYLRK